MKPFLFGPVLALGLVGGSAQAGSWECSFGGQKADGWLRGQVFLTDATETKPATVYDSLINSQHSGPIEARVSADNDQRTTFKWKLRDVHLRSGFAPRINYTLTRLKNGNDATLFAVAPGLDDFRNRGGGNVVFSAGGKCSER
ncbi:hypothetical protein NNA36_18145 [Shimia sp. CNT1-13L.2]|uniref:hypothetical protein n=1 Tax=Shimia sp. CNT1-13L.2 TaxID=2959663 RepID=UPI0020CE68D9|nr:hypothetical protein [Shimia sp. CNT1-13L.2]MCP9483889.1 hypothetical protein [Shimia sp. CNT1-13L.2]